jgi:hypothetical protein
MTYFHTTFTSINKVETALAVAVQEYNDFKQQLMQKSGDILSTFVANLRNLMKNIINIILGY